MDEEFHNIYGKPSAVLKRERELEAQAYQKLKKAVLNEKYSSVKPPFMEACGMLPISFDDEEFILTLVCERWTPMAIRLFYYNSGNSQSMLAALHSIGVMDDAELTAKELNVSERLYNIAQSRKHQRISEKLEQGFMDEKVAKVLLSEYYGIAKQQGSGIGLGQAVELHVQAYVPPEDNGGEPTPHLKEAK